MKPLRRQFDGRPQHLREGQPAMFSQQRDETINTAGRGYGLGCQRGYSAMAGGGELFGINVRSRPSAGVESRHTCAVGAINQRKQITPDATSLGRHHPLDCDGRHCSVHRISSLGHDPPTGRGGQPVRSHHHSPGVEAVHICSSGKPVKYLQKPFFGGWRPRTR